MRSPRESQQRTDHRSRSHPSNANDHISLRSLTAEPMLDVVAKSSLFRVPAAFAARGRRPRVAAPPVRRTRARRRSGPRRPDVTGQRFAAMSANIRWSSSAPQATFNFPQQLRDGSTEHDSEHRARISSPSRAYGVRTTKSSGANLLRGDRSEQPRLARCGEIWQTQILVGPSAPNEFGRQL